MLPHMLRFYHVMMCHLNRVHSFPLQEAISVPWRALPRRVSKLYFAMRGMLNPFLLFTRVNGRVEIKQLKFEFVDFRHNIVSFFCIHAGMPLDEPFYCTDFPFLLNLANFTWDLVYLLLALFWTCLGSATDYMISLCSFSDRAIWRCWRS